MIPHHDTPPHYLPEDARNWWAVIVEELQDRGTLAKVCQHRLAIYCQLFAQYHRCTEFINKEGQVLTIRDDKGEVKAQGIALEALQQEKLVKALQRFDKEFGLLEAIKTPDPLAELRQRLSARLAPSPAGHN